MAAQPSVSSWLRMRRPRQSLARIQEATITKALAMQDLQGGGWCRPVDLPDGLLHDRAAGGTWRVGVAGSRMALTTNGGAGHRSVPHTCHTNGVTAGNNGQVEPAVTGPVGVHSAANSHLQGGVRVAASVPAACPIRARTEEASAGSHRYSPP